MKVEIKSMTITDHEVKAVANLTYNLKNLTESTKNDDSYTSRNIDKDITIAFISKFLEEHYPGYEKGVLDSIDMKKLTDGVQYNLLRRLMNNERG